MLKAKQIQMHKRAKTTKNRLGKAASDKRDEGDIEFNGNAGEGNIDDNPNVNKHIKQFQSRID
eukprot:11792132-Heterocapsa_arctica.AAC.1